MSKIHVRYSVEAEPRGKADEIRIFSQSGKVVRMADGTLLQVESVGTRRTVRDGRKISVDEAWVRLQRTREKFGIDYLVVPLRGCLKQVVYRLVSKGGE